MTSAESAARSAAAGATGPAAVGNADHCCRNCGASAPGAFCAACGQGTRERLPTFAQFMREATGRYVAFDGKLWKTLAALLFRPGFLTREYFAGRRRRYIGPARLFLVSSLVLFAVLRLASESIEINDVFRSDPPTKAAPRVERPASRVESPANRGNTVAGFALDDDLSFDLGQLPDTMGVLKKRLERFNHLPRVEKVEQIIAGVLRYGPYAMFVLLPAFAVLLKVLYLGRRRRYPARPRLYGEHLVFAAHNHAFLFAVGTLLFVVPVDLVRKAIAVWALIYLVWSVRAIYGGSWLGIAARGAALVVVYSIMFGVVTAGLLVAAILLR
jgi:hypothetical protein